jgi:hypothetical protein
MTRAGARARRRPEKAAPVKISKKAKFALANAIRSDKTLSLGDRMVGLFLVERLNPRRGFAYPTKIQIADVVGLTPRSVNRSIKNLDPYFSIKRSVGSGHANEYWPRIGDRMSPFRGQQPGRQSPASVPNW